MITDSRAALDIHTHALNKLNRLLRDVSVTCQIAEIDNNETIEILMSVLLQELVKGAVCIAINEVDFGKLCRLAYRTVCREQHESIKNG